MCNACGFQCCAWDGFEGCGCDDCENPKCHSKCDGCGMPESYCECIDDDELYMSAEQP